MSETNENPLNHLKKFETKAAYNTAKKNLPTPNVSYVEEGGKCYYNPVVREDPPSYITRQNTDFGDVVLYNSTTSEFLFMHPDDYTLERSSLGNSVTPIGVIAIPQKYAPDDGGIRVMSLMSMSLLNPEGGTAEVDFEDDNNNTMRWGPNTKVTGLASTTVPCINKTTGVYTNNSFFTTYYPTDTLFDPETFTGPNGWLYYPSVSTSSNAAMGPHPIKDGVKNPDYYSNIPMDGKSNTQKIIDFATSNGLSDGWKTPTELESSVADSNYPAILSCLRYKTVGTSPGDWYLPAIGELLFVSVYFGAISEGLVAASTFSPVALFSDLRSSGLGGLTRLWSSSEYYSNLAWYVRLSCGYAFGSYFKASDAYGVRAFLRI